MRRITLPSLVVTMLLVACGDGGGDTTVTATEPPVAVGDATTTPAVPAEPTAVAASTVVLGDRTIELESIGCVAGSDMGKPRLYAFGSDQDDIPYGVRVEDYIVEVRALADEGIVARSRFAPAWDGAAVQGAGEFKVDGGLAEPLTGALEAICPVTGLESGRALDETGFERPLPEGLVCVDSGSTFSFAAGQDFSGLHSSEPEVVTYLVTNYPDAFDAAEAADIIGDPGVDAAVEFVNLAGFGEVGSTTGVITGSETVLLLSGQPSPIFTTPIPADRFSITVDIEYVDALRSNPRLQQKVDETIERYGDTATIIVEVTCAVSLEGPPHASVADVSRFGLWP